MQPTIRRKLDQLAERHQELEHLMASAEVLSDPKRLRDVSKEHAQLGPLTAALRAYDENESALESARAMLEDPELKALAVDEVDSLETERAQLEEQVRIVALVLRDQQHVERLIERVALGFERGDLVGRERFQLRIVEHRASRFERARVFVIGAQRSRQWTEMRVLARDVAQALRVAEHFGAREEVLELLVALGELVEFAADRRLHRRIIVDAQ